MKLFQRKILVQAFQLPLWGQSADEIPPQWLVRRLQSGDLEVNRLGGLTMATPFGVQSCAAGDIVLLTDDDTIQFAKPEDLAKFEVVTGDQLLKAA
ncbi:hypothetical protein [Bradyrhizobium erythrophlei]|uniref:Uncharacterized protein n=1 Tax=Bradyrhizobium erythrophlei TaxID=1437360 RepID=A0A1M5PW60_9BRAD|nr:hypothetical protein [Bradyrhizobium erythrophlei]SHH06064.1 hypothetical protein SAMN05443248_3538 [Bradyrhizobium erythrophlei]